MDKNQYEIYHENINHTPSDFPYNTYLCSIPLDFRSVKIHWHDETEIIVIKKGEGIICVDLTAYCVKAGDIVFVFPGQLHSIEQKDNAVMEYENILFKPKLLKSSGHDYCNDNFIQPLFSGKIKMSPVADSECSYYPELSALITRIDRLCDMRPHGYQLAVKGCLFEILFELVSHCGEAEIKSMSRKSLEKIKIILTYIAENYQNDISIDDISRHCFYSKSYFMKFFKEAMGTGFIQYLNDYRLEIAAGLLIDTDDNILDIAVSTGFDNLSYFNRCFKKKYGIAPGKYRANAV
ncbi:MAG: helix-turn-helix transcriptional regulator [Ruminococcus sp.]|nr:helix-turn-helix transcriptional regulator [Ruminococcus sp.]